MTIRKTSENVDISNDPLLAELEVDKSAPEYASPGGTFRYTIQKLQTSVFTKWMNLH